MRPVSPGSVRKDAPSPNFAQRAANSARCLAGQHAAADLVPFDRFEKGAEIALAEPLIALALDDLEKDRADDGVGEDLQQEPLPLRRGAVDQDTVALQSRQIL